MDLTLITRKCAYKSNGLWLIGLKRVLLIWRFMEKLVNPEMYQLNSFIHFSGSAAQRGLWPPCTTRFHDHTQRRTTVGRTPLDE
jgi:hypothetical protein